MDRKNSSSSSLKHSASDDALKKKETEEAVNQIISHLNARSDKKFRILHANVNSIKCNDRFKEIKRMLQMNKLDMVLVNETKLVSEDFNEPLLAGNYNMIRRDRFFPKSNKNVRGGGVLVYVKKSYSIVDIYRDEGALELIYVKLELTASKTPFHVVCVYKPPDVNKKVFESHFSGFMKKFGDFNGETVTVIGDLNINNLGQVEINDIEFKNVVKQATHKNHSIDAVLLGNVSDPDSLVDIEVFEEIADHKCVLASFDLIQGEDQDTSIHYTYKPFRSIFDCRLDPVQIANMIPSENRMSFSDKERWFEFKLELTNSGAGFDELDEEMDKLSIS